MKQKLLGKRWSPARRSTALLLCLCMLLSMINGFELFPVQAEAAGESGATQNVIQRIADPDTMDDYVDKMLSDENGSRYAGRVWTDKTVFAYGSGGENTISLNMDTDGYNSSVRF